MITHTTAFGIQVEITGHQEVFIRLRCLNKGPDEVREFIYRVYDFTWLIATKLPCCPYYGNDIRRKA